MPILSPSSLRFLTPFLAMVALCGAACAQSHPAESGSRNSIASLVQALKTKSKALESSAAIRHDFDLFLAKYKLDRTSISYSDFVLVRVIFEAARDAGFWNLHWSITDKPPNSEEIWRQWKQVGRPVYANSTATAECDELSALFAFLTEQSGVRYVGLFWPYPNHTVAVWVLHPKDRREIRLIVPTSQIFLTGNDSLGTDGFDPWHQKTIYEYKRNDAPPSTELSPALFAFFMTQMDKYGPASTAALQQLRNLRDAVFTHTLSPEQAARESVRRAGAYSAFPEDRAAFQHFAEDFGVPAGR